MNLLFSDNVGSRDALRQPLWTLDLTNPPERPVWRSGLTSNSEKPPKAEANGVTGNDSDRLNAGRRRIAMALAIWMSLASFTVVWPFLHAAHVVWVIPLDRQQLDAVERRIDANHATAGEWEALPGVGPTLAGRIVANRTASDEPFRSAMDLDAIHGIGPVTVDRLTPLLRFDSPPMPP